MNIYNLYGYDFDDVVRQLADGESNDNDEYHPSDVGESAHALYAGLLLVPVQRSNAIDQQHVEYGDRYERNEQSEHEGCVGPRLTVPNIRPRYRTLGHTSLHVVFTGAISGSRSNPGSV